MTNAFIYAAPLDNLSIADQLAAAHAFCARQGVAVSRPFIDDAPDAFHMPLAARPAGGELLEQLTSGALLVVNSSLLIGPRLADALALMERWSRDAVHLAVLGGATALDTREAGWGKLIGLLEAGQRLNRGGQAALTRAGFDRLRSKGGRTTKWAPIGHRWVRRGGKAFKEVDTEELEVIRRVIEWRAMGHSWRAIARHLLLCGVKTANGNDWGTRRLQIAVDLVAQGKLVLPPAPESEEAQPAPAGAGGEAKRPE